MDSGGKVLRFDQLEVLGEIEDAIAEGARRVVVQAPCGFGKTLCAASLLKMYLSQGKRVIFVVPAISLVNQTVDVFQSEGIADIGVMQAYHMMTDSRMPAQVASVQTLQRRTLPQADIVMLDECHVWFKFYGEWMLNPSWKDIPFIGLSATPWTKGLGAWFERLLIASTTRDCIEEGLLSPFKVYAPSHPDLTGVRTLAGDYHEGDLGEAMARGHLVADIVSTWRKLADNRPTFCFCVNRVHAKHVQEQFKQAGIACGYQDAYTKDEERIALKNAFANGDITVVCSVATMIMGVDWDVRCVIWARPTKSEMLFCQGTGRGLRTAEGKDCCLILDHSDNHLRLGFITDIHHDTLHSGKKQEAQQSLNIRLPKECPECSFLRPPNVSICPACGFKAQAQDKVVVEDGDLFELKPTPKSKKAKDKFSEEEAYSGMLWWAMDKGYKSGWASNKFREMFGKWPDGLSKEPKRPEAGLVAWIKHRQILWAKSKRNSRNNFFSRSPATEPSPTPPAPSADHQPDLPSIE